MRNEIQEILRNSLHVKQQMCNDALLLARIERAVQYCVEALEADKKLLFCGNGGSAADAQHLAAEFTGRFYLDRPPMFAEALHVNTSFLTAVANDYGYVSAYARMVAAAGRKGDILFAISTSGNSENILKAVEAAGRQKMITIGMTGAAGGKLAERCNVLLNVPSDDTPRIQEAHITVGHIICEFTEKAMFG